ncbi:MAG: hypothetical protein Q4A15_04495 [Prevotellaceae bacterium]|nr:hypothetical protein [Prevotellaceae bacterium]
MKDMTKMMEVICTEIDRIAEKGLTTSNLESAYKLIDMYKDLKTVEGMDDYADENYSQARGRYAKRDSMGRYSRRYDSGNSYEGNMSEQRYMNSKRAYRNDHSMASKENMLDDLNEFMGEMHDKLKELKREADTPEERETIEKYIKLLERV